MLQPVIPDGVCVVLIGIRGNVLLLKNATSDQFHTLLVPSLGEGPEQDAHDLSAIRQVNVGDLALTAAHRCGVEVIATLQILVHFGCEYLVDVCEFHNRLLLIEQLYNQRI